MSRKLFFSGCFVLAMVAMAVPASAVYTPFLTVDLNGENGPTQTTYPTGWPDPWSNWNFDRSPATNTFNATFGVVSVTITAINNADAMPGSRNRSGPDGGNDSFLSNVHRDLLFIAHDSAVGLGRDYLKFEFSGLAANTPYKFAFWNYDTGHSGALADKYMAWGTVNPAQWLDDNWGLGSSYAPDQECPVPMLARVPMAGPWPSDPAVNDPYYYSGRFIMTTNSNGMATIYGWADIDSWEGTQHAPVNGFAIGVPEPATIALLGLGGLALRRRKR